MLLTIIILSFIIVMLIGVMIIGYMFYSDVIAGLEWEIEEKKEQRNKYITRVVDLESALLWWVNECMKDYSDKQYGKGKMKELLGINNEKVFRVKTANLD